MNYALALKSSHTGFGEGFRMFKPTPQEDTANARGPETETDRLVSYSEFKETRTEERFRELVEKWKEETRYISSLTEITTSPAYLGIIYMGAPALPLLFDELRRQPDHWFTAIQKILEGTRYGPVNPVPEAHRGNLRRMTDAWLSWGEQYDLA